MLIPNADFWYLTYEADIFVQSMATTPWLELYIQLSSQNLQATSVPDHHRDDGDVAAKTITDAATGGLASARGTLFFAQCQGHYKLLVQGDC
jgi:hypothetical protein